MAESSRSRVTITLGRSGQVVKRAGHVGSSGFSEPQVAASGRKRSVRDRLGNGAEGSQQNNNNKRQRGDGDRQYTNGGYGVDDARLGKDDLRYKLMRKNGNRRVQSDPVRNGGDLRETLSRAARPSPANLSTRQQMPEPRDSRHRVPERSDASLFGRIPSSRSSDVLPPVDSSYRSSYSPWTLDRIRQRSPPRVELTPRNPSPRRNEDELIRRPVMRTYDDARPVSYTSRDIMEPVRRLGTDPYLTRPTVSAAPTKSLLPPPMAPQPPSSMMLKSSYKVDEHLTVEGLLHSLGLEKYSLCFKAEEVDMTALKQMGDVDLKQMGIPMGPRKKILLAVMSRTRRPV